MNEVWEGPGSLEKLLRLELEMKLSGRLIKFDASDFKDKKKELEKYRYKTKYRREEQYGEIDYQSYVQKLNHNGELPAPLPNRE
jgi:hypothetical protein